MTNSKGGRPRKQSKTKSKSTRKRPYEIKVPIGKDEFGKPIRKSFYSTKSEKGAREKGEKYRERMAVQKALGSPVPGSKVNFSTIAKDYLEVYKKGHVKNNTFGGTYFHPVQRLLEEFGDMDIGEIRHTDVQKYINKIAKKYTKETIRKILHCLRAIFNIAYEDSLISRNPMPGPFDWPKTRPGKEKRVYTPEQYDRVLNFARTHPYGLDIMVLMKTGITKSELMGAKPENLLDTKQLVIAQGTTEAKDPDTGKYELICDGLKTAYRARTIPIDTELYEALKNKPRTVSFATKGGKTVTVTPEFLFYSPQGKQWRPNNWYRRRYKPFMVDMHKENSDIPILTPHELRHTLATLLNNRGVNRVTMNHLFGWRGDGMLETRYAHYDPEEARKELNLH